MTDTEYILTEATERYIAGHLTAEEFDSIKRNSQVDWPPIIRALTKARSKHHN